MVDEVSTGYNCSGGNAAHTHAYLWGPVRQVLGDNLEQGDRIFELGCGNGAFAADLVARGFEVTGVDPSESGIAIANQAFPDVRLKCGSAYDDLATAYGQFSAVVSLEVVEHVYYPRKFARCVRGLLQPDGIAIISTPYHGYLKNLALAVSGKMDGHFTAL